MRFRNHSYSPTGFAQVLFMIMGYETTIQHCFRDEEATYMKES